MKSSRQKLYDSFYYGFDRWLIGLFEDVRAWKRVRGVRFDRAFYDNYKNVVAPYWRQYGIRMPLYWAKDNYLFTRTLEPRHIPNSLYIRRVIPHFNDLRSVEALTDKNLTSLLFPDVKRPETVCKHMSGVFRREDMAPMTRAEAQALLCPGQDYVIKPARDSSSGHGVRFFTAGAETEAVLAQYDGFDYIVQRPVTQHPGLAALNESSVNTIRIITVYLHGRACTAAAIMRAGTPGSRVDNTGSGGWFCAIRPDGTLAGTAYSYDNGRAVLTEREINGVVFEGREVPSYHKAEAFALALAERTPHLALIAWDLAIDEAGECVLIEFNAHTPTLIRICGPCFGAVTDEVLANVFPIGNCETRFRN